MKRRNLGLVGVVLLALSLATSAEARSRGRGHEHSRGNHYGHRHGGARSYPVIVNRYRVIHRHYFDCGHMCQPVVYQPVWYLGFGSGGSVDLHFGW